MVLLQSNTNKADKEAVEPVLAQFDELEKRIASRFARLEALEAALAYIVRIQAAEKGISEG